MQVHGSQQSRAAHESGGTCTMVRRELCCSLWQAKEKRQRSNVPV